MEAMSTPDASSEWDLTVPMTTPSCWPSIVATAFASPLQTRAPVGLRCEQV
jgi:hypothetical protein